MSCVVRFYLAQPLQLSEWLRGPAGGGAERRREHFTPPGILVVVLASCQHCAPLFPARLLRGFVGFLRRRATSSCSLVTARRYGALAHCWKKRPSFFQRRQCAMSTCRRHPAVHSYDPVKMIQQCILTIQSKRNASCMTCPNAENRIGSVEEIWTRAFPTPRVASSPWGHSGGTGRFWPHSCPHRASLPSA